MFAGGRMSHPQCGGCGRGAMAVWFCWVLMVRDFGGHFLAVLPAAAIGTIALPFALRNVRGRADVPSAVRWVWVRRAMEVGLRGVLIFGTWSAFFRRSDSRCDWDNRPPVCVEECSREGGCPIRSAWGAGAAGNGGRVARGIDFRDLVGIFSPLGQPLRLGQSPSLLR